MNICLYCPNPANSLEHPLPAAFGEFQNAPLLQDRICDPCNSTRLGRLDEQLARCGPEAVLRRFYGIQGRKTHEDVNPHYRGSAGGRRLAMTAFDTAIGAEVELEMSHGQVRQSRQMVVIDTDRKAHHLPIPADLRDPEKLRDLYRGLGVTQPVDVRLIFDPSEREWLLPLIQAAWPASSFAEKGSAAMSYEGATTKLQVTDRYFRALAKIGFHYFLSQATEYDGSEPCFSGIRNFIIGDGGIDSINNFVAVRARPLLAQMMDGARPDGWKAHVVCFEIRADECLAHVQLFVCPDYPAPVYTIRLGRNGSGAAIAASGHAYLYFMDGPRGRFAGETQALEVTRAMVEAAPLRPAIGR